MASKLSKAKMPAKKQPELEFDLSELELGDAEASEEAPEELALEGEADELDMDAMEPSADLDKYSDEEILAELEKRGLSADLAGSEEIAADDEALDAEEEDLV